VSPTRIKARELKDLVEELTETSVLLGREIADLVQGATEQPLPEGRARSLYTKILVTMRTAGTTPDQATLDRVAEEVREDVEEALQGRAIVRKKAANATRAATVRTRTASAPPAIELIEQNGLVPHSVRPIPDFNGKKITVEEGYVDVTTVDLWKGNHRIELAVKEFRQREGRDPDDDELLAIVQGKIVLPSLAKNKAKNKRDPFDIIPLARSIARKGVERPPIFTWDGEPKDGNRRLAAAKYVVSHPRVFSADEQERARWVRVWRCPPETTEDEVEAIVVSLNFEEDYKQPWPSYVKARLVAREFERRRTGMGRATATALKEVKEQVADQFAIDVTRVNRYLKMVDWADDFEQYHVDEKGRDRADVSYRTNDIFEWFYELDAGRQTDKLTKKLDLDEDLKSLVYDLMFDVLDSGLQVRTLHKVVDDGQAVNFLEKALDTWNDRAEGDEDERKKKALESVEEALQEAKRKGETTRKTRLGFDSWLRDAVDRFGATPPDYWQNVDIVMLADLQRVLHSAIGSIEGAIRSRTTAAAS
jgi:hypothetical protein